MNCINCGTSLNDNAKFCTKCGTVIQSIPEISTQNIPANKLNNFNQPIYTTPNMMSPAKKSLSNKQHNAIHVLMGLIIIILTITTIYFGKETFFWYDASNMYRNQSESYRNQYEEYINRSPEEKTKDAISSWFN